jgi:hypothetical protein
MKSEKIYIQSCYLGRALSYNAITAENAENTSVRTNFGQICVPEKPKNFKN